MKNCKFSILIPTLPCGTLQQGITQNDRVCVFYLYMKIKDTDGLVFEGHVGYILVTKFNDFKYYAIKKY